MTEYYSEYYSANSSMNPLRFYFIKELDENSIKFDEESKFVSNIKLKDHQLSLLNKCIEFENNNCIEVPYEDVNMVYNNIQTHYGIIADKTGSGKSYVVLSLILFKKSLQKEYQNIRNIGSLMTCKKTEEFHECPCNLIIIPHNIKSQWLTYAKNINDNLKYFIVDSNKSLEKCLDDWDTTYKYFDIIFITGSFYRYIEEYLNTNNCKVSRVIYDEADTCRIPCCKKIIAHFYWFITASYKNILYPYQYCIWNKVTGNRDMLTTGVENNKFIKEIFRCNMNSSENLLHRKIFDNLVIKNKDTYVDLSFNLPNIIYSTIICKEPLYVNLLSGIVSNQILQYLHGGDIQGAMECVNKNNVNTQENIINKILEDYIFRLNNIDIKIEYINRTSFQNENDRTVKLQKVEAEKLILSNKLNLLRERLQSTDDECVICFSEIDIKTITKCCNNSYCLKCISQWLKKHNSCPLCKSKVDFNTLYYVNEQATAPISETESKFISENYSKYDNVLKLLDSRLDNSKFLICSDYENSLIELETKFREKHIKYDKLKGNNIKNTVDRYKNSDLNLLMLNSRYYGSGLNLENTTDIILFHKLDSEIEKQVIGRAQRPGRTTPLNIWYMLHKSEKLSSTL
jgi:hypothetical protein